MGVKLLDLKKIGDNDLITVPPYREQTGRRILLYKIGKKTDVTRKPIVKNGSSLGK